MPWHWVSVVTWYFEGALGKAKPMAVSYPLQSCLSVTPDLKRMAHAQKYVAKL